MTRRRAALAVVSVALAGAGILLAVRSGSPLPLLPLTAERYLQVSVALKESLAACVAEEQSLAARFPADPARLSRGVAEANKAHREREAKIFECHRTTPRDFGDFLLIPANRAATKKLLAADRGLSEALANLERRRREPVNAAPGGGR